MSEADKKRGRGRPGALGELPPDTRHRSIRLSDAEWEAVCALVAKMRGKPKPKPKPRRRGK